MTAWLDLNASQWLGVAGFAASTVACATAACATRACAPAACATTAGATTVCKTAACKTAAAAANGSPWTGLAWLQGACLAEVVVGLRLRLHDWVGGLLQRSGEYGARERVQVPALEGLGIALTVLVVAIWFFARGRSVAPSARLAGVASVAAPGLFLLEAVSLHAVDQVVYRAVGPFLLIALLWFGAALTVGLAALWALAARRSRHR